MGRLAVSLGLGIAPRHVGGGGGAPVTFTPRISFDGDSISAQANYGFVAHYMADLATSNPAIATTNLSVAGATIATTENATNCLDLRVSNVASFAPTLHVICIGTNDLAAIDANTTISRLTTHISNLRAAGVTAKIAVCGVGPCSGTSTGGHANVNGRRGSYNSQLRAAVGGLIDAYIPRGEHPIFGVDAAASNATWWNADGIHPLQLPHRAYWQMLHDVIDPYIAQAGGAAAAPTLSLPNLSDVVPSAVSAVRARVSGLGLGQTTTLAIAGGAQIARGTGAFGITDLALMNGDVPQVQQAASASNSTELDSTVTFNGVASTWKLTTQPAAWPANATTLDATRKASTVTLSGTPPLTATAGSGGANQLAMPTASPAADLVYFEVTMGVSGDAANGKNICIHDATLVANYNKLPGLSAGFTNAGLSITGGTAVVNVGGTTITAVDFLNIPAIASGSVVGVLVQLSSGKVWLQLASNSFWPGDPTVLDGGVKLPAPLAQYFCDLAVKTLSQGATINYGGTGAPVAFSYPVPTGFRPHC